MVKFVHCSLLLAAAVAISGCGEPKANDSGSKDGSSSSHAEKVNAADFLLTSEPANAQPVAAVRADAEDEQNVVIVGRIGGSTHPWVDGVAAFTIVDESLAACGDGREECSCPTPWDYCCETSETIVAHSVTVKFVGDNEKVRRFDPKDVFGLSELATVVVEGSVDRDDTGKFSILAKKMFVRK